jgi:adenosylcobinamide hydrolase
VNTTQPEKLDFPGATLQQGDRYYLVRLEHSAQFLSSAPFGEGLVSAGWILSGQVSPQACLPDPVSYLRRLAAQLGVPDRPDGTGVVGLLTAVDHRDLQVSSLAEPGLTVTILATVGVDHGSSSRDKDIGVHGEPSTAEAQPLIRPGTINLVTLVDAGLSAGALVRASTVATEAKTLAMVEAGLKTRQGHIATGAATDTTVVGHSGRGEHFRYAGSATLVGWLIGRAVYQSVTLGLAAYNIRKPNR